MKLFLFFWSMIIFFVFLVIFLRRNKIRIYILSGLLYIYTFTIIWKFWDVYFLDMISELGLKFTVRDPQDYINLKIFWSSFFSLWNVCFLFCFILLFFSLGYLLGNRKSFWVWVFINFLFYFYGIYFLIKNDLLFSNWPEKESLQNLGDFFLIIPDFSKVSSIFRMELEEILLFVLKILLFFLIKNVLWKNFLSGFLKKENEKTFERGKKLWRIKYFGNIYIFGVLFSFYGGESFFRDFLIFLLSFFCIELFSLTFLILFQIKCWRKEGRLLSGQKR